jgi:SAM-dependent methyltransferase
MTRRSLLLGCGNNHSKRVAYADNPEWAGELTKLDMNPNCGADIVCDLDARPLPFDDDTFDEMGAYDVLEHLGRQGDWKGFFDEFSEYWRILKPGGLFGIIVPINKDALADPGHTRFFSKTQFFFLNQGFYDENLGKGAPVTDYRWFYRRNFNILLMQEDSDATHHHLGVVLQKA